jgi:hypothetical protein
MDRPGHDDGYGPAGEGDRPGQQAEGKKPKTVKTDKSTGHAAYSAPSTTGPAHNPPTLQSEICARGCRLIHFPPLRFPVEPSRRTFGINL